MKSDIKEIMIYLDSGCQRRNNIDPQSQYSLWVDMFGCYRLEDMKRAAQLHMSKSNFFPTPKEFMDVLNKVNAQKITYPLLFEKREKLESDFYSGEEIDHEDWQKLADEFESINYPSAAKRLMEKCAMLQEAK